VRKGFYIRPFAEREVRVHGLEVPPLMWIFEWNRLGGWHSLASLVYQGTRDEIGVAIDEGYASAAAVREARQTLESALANAGHRCARECDDVRRSLEYQETIFDVLAAWRQAFLSYYRWLDTGDLDAWSQWIAGRSRFEISEARHLARFGTDLDFPAFDLTSADQAISIAGRGAWVRRVAGALLIGVGLFFGTA